MTQKLRRPLVLLAFATLWQAPSLEAEKTLTLLELMQGLAARPDRHASFLEEKQIKALSAPIESRGRLLYIRPSHLEKNTVTPAPEQLVVDGDMLTITPGPGQPTQTFDLASRPLIRALVETVRGTLSGDLPSLERYYRVTLEGTAQAWRLTLIPADPRVARLVREVRIAGTGADLREIDTVQQNGDSTRMLIEPNH